MRTLFLLLSFIPSIIFAEDFILLCNGEEIKYIEADPSTERGAKKIIGIQVYQKGMRVDGEWFDNKTDLTEDYSLERSYIKTKENIDGNRNFITSSLIKDKNIQTIKIDKVEIDLLTYKIFWRHAFNRVDITNEKREVIYAYKKNFTGICKKRGEL
jgi:hypothetical protein